MVGSRFESWSAIGSSLGRLLVRVLVGSRFESWSALGSSLGRSRFESRSALWSIRRRVKKAVKETQALRDNILISRVWLSDNIWIRMNN